MSDFVNVAVAGQNRTVNVKTKDSGDTEVPMKAADGVFAISQADYDELGPDGLGAVVKATPKVREAVAEAAAAAPPAAPEPVADPNFLKAKAESQSSDPSQAAKK